MACIPVIQETQSELYYWQHIPQPQPNKKERKYYEISDKICTA